MHTIKYKAYLIILSFCTLVSVSSSIYAEVNPVSIKHINLRSFSTYDFLINQGFKPRRDVEPWKFSLPIAWSADPFSDRNWQFQLHAWRIIDPILKHYYKTQDLSILNQAIDIIIDWYDYHISQDKSSEMQWYDMSTGIRAMKLAWLWHEIILRDILLTASRKEKLQQLMVMHVEKLMDESFLSKGNHAYFQLVGLRLLCNANNAIITCDKEPEYNNNKMQALLHNQFTAQGVHRENAPYYHFFALGTVKSLNIVNLYNKNISNLLKRAADIAPWLVYPDKNVARIGDSEGKSNTSFPADTPIYHINDTDVLIGDLINSGYFTMRTALDVPITESTQLFITGTSNLDLPSHKHADELSFELFHKGELVIVDSGKYTYNKNAKRYYVRSARAHNTLSMSNIDITRYDADDTGSKLQSYSMTNAKVTLSGAVKRSGLLVHTRDFTIVPFNKITITDNFEHDMNWFSTIKYKLKGLLFTAYYDYKELWSSVTRIFQHTHFTNNLHINPKFTVTKIDKNKVAIGDVLIITMTSTSCKLHIIKGSLQPLLGWVSFIYNNIVPTSVVQARCPVNIPGTVVWDIKLL